MALALCTFLGAVGCKSRCEKARDTFLRRATETMNREIAAAPELGASIRANNQKVIDETSAAWPGMCRSIDAADVACLDTLYEDMSHGPPTKACTARILEHLRPAR